MMKQVTTTFALIVVIALHSFSFINAMNMQCRLKYTGNLVIENQTSTLIGIATSLNLLGRVPYTVADGSMYRPVQFQFVECIVEGYSCHPEEYGFLIAQPVNPKYCATAFKVEGHMPKKYSINHHTCNYDGSDMDLINRQLVKAQYIPPEGSKYYGAKVLITFEGSPNKQTSTGFNNQHAFFHPLGQPYSQNGAVIISNDTDSPELALTEVQIHKTTSMVPGKKTTNEDGFEKFFAWAFHMDFSSEFFDEFFHKQQSQSNS